MANSRGLLRLLAVAFALEACIVDEYYYVYPDAEVDAGLDGSIRRDSGSDGGGLDATADATADARPDTQVVITRPCVREGGTTDFCSCATFGAACDPQTPCPFGQVCLNNGCGNYCQPRGAQCSTEDDCAEGTPCTNGACARATAGCSDSRDCPDGYACEFGQCIDRRIPCQTATHCPWGYVCVQGQGEPHCKKLYRECVSNTACGEGYVCVDADRDDNATGNCIVGNGVCNNPSQCIADTARSCGSSPVQRSMQCGPFGPCREATDCTAGMRCLDLWGDGVKECVPATGSCETSADCPMRQVCAVPYNGTELRCVTGMYSS